MYKHIFTLGLVLTSIYTTVAMAWPSQATRTTTSDVWTDSTHKTKATEHCSDCCAKEPCWLPEGPTYYDNKGVYKNTCNKEPDEPTCIAGKVYEVINGQCREKLSCDSSSSMPEERTYDIGAGVCVLVPGTNVKTATYDTMTWTTPIVVNSSTTVTVYGAARCTSTDLGGAFAVARGDYTPTGSGIYCVCRMTSVNGDTNIFSRWVQRNEFTDANTCSDQCPKYCSGREFNDARSWCAIFGSVEIN